ncbi:MAG: cysteine desulfurase-like protein [Pirellulaceae bacterium]|nr:cysteine desulfurase-like protein [Pirellulaceae bacterium]
MFPELRSQFPALSRRHNALPVIYLDGPAGSQVPQRVIDAISDYYCHHNANRAGQFDTSRETDGLMADAHAAAAAWFGAADPRETIFGANMTTLTFQFSRAHSRTWNPGDTVVVTQLDHDANVSPWRLAAADRGANLRVVKVTTSDATLDLEDFEQALKLRPKLVAVTAASNSVGSRTPIVELIAMAHAVGAEVYVDAVHLAPHALLDVQAWDADFVVCSAYKFFGPHVGILWGRLNRLTELTAYKVTPAPDASPGKWMTGTQNHAAICGVTAAIDYLCDIGRQCSGNPTAPRRAALIAAMQSIEQYERQLLTRLIAGLQQIPRVTVFGITDPHRFHARVPTLALAVDGLPSAQVAARLAERGIYCWHGHYYAIAICEALGQQAHGMVRLGLMHTNTAEEVERTLATLREITTEATRCSA